MIRRSPRRDRGGDAAASPRLHAIGRAIGGAIGGRSGKGAIASKNQVK
ncbi:MAG: hypothetical protein GDA56_29850 [Hormoscilla sp. GM7CHS1pb]|nr:hypothetical protein [Hormoscilla sp. GM7CHS1pb]